MEKMNETKDIYMDTVLLRDEILLRKIKNVNSLPVSIVLSSYRKKENLADIITKLMSQSFKEFEIVIVDDSTDTEIEEVFENYSNYSNINYIKKQLGSKAVSKNIALENSKGEFVIFLEESVKDISYDYIEGMLTAIKENHSDIVVLFNKNNINFYNEVFSKSKVVTGDLFLNKEIRNLHHNIDTFLASFIFRRQFLNVYGLKFNTELLEKEDLEFKLLTFSKAKKVEGITSAYYIKKSKFSNNNDAILEALDNRKRNSIKMIESFSKDKYNKDVLLLLVGYLYLELLKSTNSDELKKDIKQHIKNNRSYFEIDNLFRKFILNLSLNLFVKIYII